MYERVLRAGTSGSNTPTTGSEREFNNHDCRSNRENGDRRGSSAPPATKQILRDGMPERLAEGIQAEHAGHDRSRFEAFDPFGALRAGSTVSHSAHETDLPNAR